MTTYAFPSITPSETVWELVSNTATFRSPLSNTIQTIDRGGEFWRVRMTFRNLKGDDKAELKAYLTKLNGQQHRASLYDHSQIQRGNFGGTPVVNGAAQTGVSLNIDGCSNNITDWIKAGDHFSVNGELKMAISDSDTNGSGEATLNFRPRLRVAPGDGNGITTSNPSTTFMLADPVVGWSNQPADFSDFTVIFVEDIIS